MAAVNIQFPTIAFLSDFGNRENYAGIVKGVIRGINPKAEVIDLTHLVPACNIAAGKYLLETAYRDFPPGTIFLAVVDPGVGTARKGILVEIDRCFFIGPDNGLFSFLTKKEIRGIYHLNNKKYFLGTVSSTFHGRDIFAPVAGYLSLGVLPSEVGRKISGMISLSGLSNKRQGTKFIGGVIYIDHFGNIITSFKVREFNPGGSEIYLGNIRIGKVKETFGSVRRGEPVAYINSSGYLEIAVREGSAARYFDINYDSGIKILIAPIGAGR
jgi:S-adenosylmethionine hydrolase